MSEEIYLTHSFLRIICTAVLMFAVIMIIIHIIVANCEL